MLGRTVQLVPADPTWPAAFAREAARLREAAGDTPVVIEHIGSTAVPRLLAKPTVDVLVGVPTLADADALVPKLQALGYDYVQAFEAQLPRRRFLRTPSGTFHLHVVERGGAFWYEHLAFRDWLRSHADDARRYGFLKQQLAQRYTNDREAYTDGKAPFVAEILRQARGA
ncbi:GrpB family protein [Vulgatibacter sp.]|uniref:GrpB family protein n=1 Tax=Vulgatibacter sp. TaxID=1971226 RepID=UPI00356768A6